MEQKFERLLGPKGGVFWMALWELHIYLFIKENHLFVLFLKLRLVLAGSGYLQVKFQGLGYVWGICMGGYKFEKFGFESEHRSHLFWKLVSELTQSYFPCKIGLGYLKV